MASMDEIDKQIADAQERVKRLKRRKVEMEAKQHLEELEAFVSWAQAFKLETKDGSVTVWELYQRVLNPGREPEREAADDDLSFD